MPIHTQRDKATTLLVLCTLDFSIIHCIVHSIINQKATKRDEHNYRDSFHSYKYNYYYVILLTLMFQLNFEDFPVS